MLRKILYSVVALAILSSSGYYYMYGNYTIGTVKGNGWSAELKNGSCSMDEVKLFLLFAGAPEEMIDSMKNGTLTNPHGDSEEVCWTEVKNRPKGQNKFMVSATGRMGFFVENNEKVKIEEGPSKKQEI